MHRRTAELIAAREPKMPVAAKLILTAATIGALIVGNWLLNPSTPTIAPVVAPVVVTQPHDDSLTKDIKTAQSKYYSERTAADVIQDAIEDAK